METSGGGAGRRGGGGEEGGAEEFDRTEGRAPGNEVHLVFVRAREEREAFRFARPEDKLKSVFVLVILHLHNCDYFVFPQLHASTATHNANELVSFVILPSDLILQSMELYSKLYLVLSFSRAARSLHKQHNCEVGK